MRSLDLLLLPVTLIPIELTDESRIFMMRLSFMIGAIHLSLAQLWQGVRYFPDLRWLNRLGWAFFIWGMYGVVKHVRAAGPHELADTVALPADARRRAGHCALPVRAVTWRRCWAWAWPSSRSRCSRRFPT